MPAYKIYRLREAQRQQFRWAAHTNGPTGVKPKDYEPDGSVEAPSVYGAWSALREGGRDLRVGDLLELESGDLRVCKYVGLEEARWVLPEAKPDVEAAPRQAGSAGWQPQ